MIVHKLLAVTALGVPAQTPDLARPITVSLSLHFLSLSPSLEWTGEGISYNRK